MLPCIFESLLFLWIMNRRKPTSQMTIRIYLHFSEVVPFILYSIGLVFYLKHLTFWALQPCSLSPKRHTLSHGKDLSKTNTPFLLASFLGGRSEDTVIEEILLLCTARRVRIAAPMNSAKNTRLLAIRKITSHWKTAQCLNWKENLQATSTFTNTTFSRMKLLSFKCLIYLFFLSLWFF